LGLKRIERGQAQFGLGVLNGHPFPMVEKGVSAAKLAQGLQGVDARVVIGDVV
jgi:hypothetical protein